MDKRLGDRKTNAAPRRPLGAGAMSPFVGRDEELRRLAEGLDRAAEGQGLTVFLAGEQGIGKTRLAREALALARRRGFTVLEGRAYPLEAGLAYGPFLDSFGPLLRDLDPARRRSLLGDLPSLGRLFEGLRLSSPEPLNDPALEKSRLFEAVSRLVGRLTQEAPVALFLDDLHWADPVSLELSHYVARGLANQRALFLATYATNTSGDSGGLRSLVLSLKRAGLADEVAIPRLEPNAVGELAQGILGGEVPNDLFALLDARAGGTPLYVEAFVNGLVGSGILIRVGRGWVLGAKGANTLPPNVRELVLERHYRLPVVDRYVLDLIAVLGEPTSHSILQAACNCEQEILIKALRSLSSSGLVGEVMDGSEVTYIITHPLIQEVAYGDLQEMERRRAHMAAIKALESFPEGRSENLNRLARHYQGAGPEANSDRALATLMAAGERSLAIYANEEAARHFEAALTILRRGRGSGAGNQAASPTPGPRPAPGGHRPIYCRGCLSDWARPGSESASEKLPLKRGTRRWPNENGRAMF